MLKTITPTPYYRRDYQPPEFTIPSIRLCFELQPQRTRVTARSQVVRNATADSSTLWLDGQDLQLIQLEINGAPWPHYQLLPEGLQLQQRPARFEMLIVTEINPADNASLNGLYQSGQTLCTQCEAEGFRRITYCLDRPDVLTRYRTKIIARAHDYPTLLSNGNRLAQGSLADGRHWVEWEDPFPKPCYLFALVAGRFDQLTDQFITRSGRPVTLEFYVECGKRAQATWALNALKQAMRWDEQRFGLEYDLDLYLVVAVSFFNMGAMENKGLNIFNDKYVLAQAESATDEDHQNITRIIGHEYFHNWTGNRVTCRDWFQLSLKEGLTVFREQEFMADHGEATIQRIDSAQLIQSAQFAEDASPLAHPIRPEEVLAINNFYTLTVYEKGAEVIRMLHTWLGETPFQAGLRLYLQRHDGQAATCDNFLQAMAEASGQDLEQFRLWYSQSGTPQLTVTDDYDPTTQEYRLTVRQHTPPTADQAEKHPLLIPLGIALYDQQGHELPLIRQGTPQPPLLMLTQAQHTFLFESIPQKPLPALLTGFSAPVKVEYAYQPEQLAQLLQQATDPFIRWEASQRLVLHAVQQNVARYQQQQPLQLPPTLASACRTLLETDLVDPALKVRLLTVATEAQLAEHFDPIDPEALAAARRFIQQQLAQTLQQQWLALYQATAPTTAYAPEPEAIQRRALCNLALHYLALAETTDRSTTKPTPAEQRVMTHYYQADNLTDQLAALSSAITAQLPCHTELLAQFEAQWQHEGLVMDKWFTLQALSPTPDVLARIQSLRQHPAFNGANPNRSRALIGSFCTQNLAAFHALDGSGYRLLTAVLQQIDSHNPQLAARLVEPLMHFQRYAAPRNTLMRQALQQLATLPKLSQDLFEKVNKALKA